MADDTGRYIINLTGADLVAIKQSLRLYRDGLVEGLTDADPDGVVRDIEHVTDLIDRLEEYK